MEDLSKLMAKCETLGFVCPKLEISFRNTKSVAKFGAAIHSASEGGTTVIDGWSAAMFSICSVIGSVGANFAGGEDFTFIGLTVIFGGIMIFAILAADVGISKSSAAFFLFGETGSIGSMVSLSFVVLIVFTGAVNGLATGATIGGRGLPKTYDIMVLLIKIL